MLVCRLEILTLHSSSEEPAHWIMQPQVWGSVQWCTGKWHYLVAVVKDLATCYLAGGSLGYICIKPILSYLSQDFNSKVLFWRVDITPNYYIVASYVALGAIQQSWNLRHHHFLECMVLSSGLGFLVKILIIQNRWGDYSVHSMSRDSIVHNRGHG
jgi:hypothetical protein